MGDGHAAAFLVLDDEVRGVRRHDAVLARELGDLFFDFLFLAVQPDFIEQITDASCGPQARDERMIRLGGEGNWKFKLRFLAGQRAFEQHVALAFAFVTANEHELFALKQIGQRTGVKFAHPNAFGEFQLGIGQHGLFYFCIKTGDLHFDVLVGCHVSGTGAGFLGDFIEQMRVHIRADAEAKHAGFAGGGAHVFHDLAFAGDADGGAAVGEKNHKEGPVAFFRLEVKGLDEGGVDGGAADGLEVADEIQRLFAIAGAGFFEAAKERFGFGGETHDLEAVAVIQIRHAKLECFFRLFQFVAGHRAGSVDDKRDVFFGGLAFGGVHARRGEHQEIAVTAFAMGDDVHVDVFLLGRIVEREVAVGPHAFAFESDDRFF